MGFAATERISLDYEGAVGDIVGQLSGIAVAPSGHLWTVSDEERTIECLAPARGAYKLSRQIRIDDLVAGIPPGELDLEAIAIEGRHLWVAGSHGKVRVKPSDAEHDRGVLLADIRARENRHLLARFRFDDVDPTILTRPRYLPLTGSGSLRDWLKGDAWLGRFLELPSKENGLDIEGVTPWDGALMLGCRGPLLDSMAVVIALSLEEPQANHAFRIQRHALHFLDLGGLGIRDLAADAGGIIVIAGPVTDARTPFRLFRWTPGNANLVTKPELIGELPSEGEKPEGVCHLGSGLILLHDSPSRDRISGMTYSADWGPFP